MGQAPSECKHCVRQPEEEAAGGEAGVCRAHPLAPRRPARGGAGHSDGRGALCAL